MGDFEDVFGAGADSVEIVRGYSRSVMSEVDREVEDYEEFVTSIFMKAKIEELGLSLYFEDYESAIAFEKASQPYEVPDFTFTRRRDGDGYRMIINRDSYKSHFTLVGRIVVAGSHEQANLFSNKYNAPVFETIIPKVRALSYYKRKLYQKSEIEWAEQHFKFVDSACFNQSTSLFDALALSQDVVVYGRFLGSILETRAKFIGWSAANGFNPITDYRTLTSYSYR